MSQFISDILKYLKVTPAAIEVNGWAKFEPGSSVGVIIRSGWMRLSDHAIQVTIGDTIELADR